MATSKLPEKRSRLEQNYGLADDPGLFWDLFMRLGSAMILCENILTKNDKEITAAYAPEFERLFSACETAVDRFESIHVERTKREAVEVHVAEAYDLYKKYRDAQISYGDLKRSLTARFGPHGSKAFRADKVKRVGGPKVAAQMFVASLPTVRKKLRTLSFVAPGFAASQSTASPFGGNPSVTTSTSRTVQPTPCT